MSWLFTVACLGFLSVTLWAERTGNRQLRFVGKTSASLCFVALGLLAADSDQSYSTWIVAGLVFGAAGDIALLFDSRKAFLIGLLSFLAGHMAFVIAFAVVVPMESWFAPVALLPVVAATGMLVYLWPHLGAMRAPVLAYVAAIVLMVQGAIALYRASPGSIDAGSAHLALVGALLFFASDVSVAKARFVRATFVDKLWGLPAYYLGQLCIAWSLVS